MKREIKFRAFIDGEMIDGDSLAFEQYEPISKLLTNCENIMQYIGLKDKNGVGIYEGDIIRHCIFGFYDVKQLEPPTYDKNEVVTFCRGYFGLNDEIASFDCMNHTYEVIGNIHQHHHLLSK